MINYLDNPTSDPIKLKVVQERQELDGCSSLICSALLVGLVAMVVIGGLSLLGRFPLSFEGGLALTVIGSSTLGLFSLIGCSLCCQCYRDGQAYEATRGQAPLPVLAPDRPAAEPWTHNPFA